MKKMLALAMILTTVLTLSACGGSSEEERVVNVCSWGEYIDDSLIYQFEDETGIKVNYQTAESNEALYSLLKTGCWVPFNKKAVYRCCRSSARKI